MFRPILILPLLAICGVLFAVISVIRSSRPVSVPPPVIEPARAPFAAFVAGAGLIEASTRNANISTPVSGIVASVPVKVGDTVKTGQPLFTLDTRELAAALAVSQAAVATAQAQVTRQESFPRAEVLPPLQARVTEAATQLEDAQVQLSVMERVAEGNAAGAEELTRRRFAVTAARARLSQVSAELSLTQAGAWSADKEVAQAQLRAAQAAVDSVRVEISRRTVTAPFDGEVLQVNAIAGEFAASGQAANPLIVLGATDVLHVRVDIDEHDAWRVRPQAPGMAFIRGNKDLNTPIEFVRFEPLVIPKRSLTGDSSERVDTRVLQAIYRFPRSSLAVFVGQQMDVYIEAMPLELGKPRPAEAGKGP